MLAGTSGWSYRHWRARFYPRGVPVRAWLPHYAQHFPTVELNTSFYAIPKPTSIAAWQAAVPADFVFAIKLWRGITHYRKLVDCDDAVRRFLDAFTTLDPARRGPLLVQLPPFLNKDITRLARFLDLWAEATHKQPWPLAVELRNPQWLVDDVRAVLDARGAALCVQDHAELIVDEPNDAPFVYLRRHGPQGTYRDGYSDATIAADARRVRGWLDKGRRVYAYYNNDIGGHAPVDAARLAEAVQAGGKKVPTGS